MRNSASMLFARFSCTRNSASMLFARFSSTRNSASMLFARFPHARNSASMLFARFSSMRNSASMLFARFSCTRNSASMLFARFSSMRNSASIIFARFSSMRNSAAMLFARCPTMRNSIGVLHFLLQQSTFQPLKLRASAAYYICTIKVDFPEAPAACYVCTTEGATGHARIRKNAQRAPTRTIPAERATSHSRIRKNAQRERSDTHDPRKGCDRPVKNTQKRTAGALRHARSPQRVRQASQECAKTHSGSAPTRTIPAEGARFSSKTGENAQRERSDTHDPRRGGASR